jgi:hypothetical protein
MPTVPHTIEYICMIIGIIVNVLVITTICKYRKVFSSPYYILCMSQMICGILMGIGTIILTGVLQTPKCKHLCVCVCVTQISSQFPQSTTISMAI